MGERVHGGKDRHVPGSRVPDGQRDRTVGALPPDRTDGRHRPRNDDAPGGKDGAKPGGDDIRLISQDDMKDLRTFFHEWEKKVPTDVLRIEEEVDPRFEISAYTLELERVGKNPILFFNKVKGFDIPVLSNLLATKERVAAGIDTPSQSIR